MPITDTNNQTPQAQAYDLPEVSPFERYQTPDLSTRNPYARIAYSDVAATLNQQIGGFEREANLARQRSLEELQNSRNFFGRTLGDLDYQRTTQETEMDRALRQLADESTFGAQRLQEQINPAILAARQQAARSGLLNSTVALDRINQGLSPISQGLVDIERKRQTGTQNINQQRTDLINRFLTQRQQSLTEQATQEQQIRDAYSQLVEQARMQAGDVLGSARPAVLSRYGELRSEAQQYGLQRRNLLELIRSNRAAEAIQRESLKKR